MVESAARLGGLHPVTAQAIADFLRPACSYYSNLIEGHGTHLLAIAQVPQAEYAPDSRNRLLQLEVLAHIEVHRQLPALLASGL
jgi:hypothetical protein